MRKKLVLMIICMCLLLLLTGCGKELSTEDLEKALTTTLDGPSEVLPGENVPEFLNYIEQNNSFEVESFDVHDDLVTAQIKVTSPDLYTAVKTVIVNNTVSDEQQANQLILEELKKQPSVEKTIKLEFTYSDSEYLPVLTDEFLDSYYGGVFQIRDEMINMEVGNK